MAEDDAEDVTARLHAQGTALGAAMRAAMDEQQARDDVSARLHEQTCPTCAAIRLAHEAQQSVAAHEASATDAARLRITPPDNPLNAREWAARFMARASGSIHAIYDSGDLTAWFAVATCAAYDRGVADANARGHMDALHHAAAQAVRAELARRIEPPAPPPGPLNSAYVRPAPTQPTPLTITPATAQFSRPVPYGADDLARGLAEGGWTTGTDDEPVDDDEQQHTHDEE